MRELGGKERKALGMIFSLVSVICFAYICKFAMGNDIWYDEVFSLAFVKKSYSQIIALTSRDVHPPFYYFYLKAVTSAICAFAGPDKLIIAAKIASLIPWFFLLLLSMTYIRRRFGILSGGLFMLLVTLMPQIPAYYVEIRMYSLALFLITSEILLTHNILSADGKRKTASWLLFFLVGILTAYTQYYACIAVIGCYAALFIGLFLGKRADKKALLLRFIACVASSVILYLPWLPRLKNQMESISGKYWIQPLTLRSILGCAKFILLPVVYMGKFPVISAGLLIVTLLILTYLFIKRADKKDISFALCCLMPAVIVVLSGFILSALGTPIFVYRYLIPTLGGLWLFAAYMAEKAVNKRVLIILFIPMLLACGLNLKGLSDEEGNKLSQIQLATPALEEIPEGSVIITNFDHVCAVTAFYRPDCSVCLHEAEIDPLLKDMLGNITDNLNDQAVKSFVSGDASNSPQNIYFFGSFNSRDEIVANWAEMGISSPVSGSYLIERYWINIYKLSGVDDE